MITHHTADNILKYMFGYQEYSNFMDRGHTAYLGLSSTEPCQAKTGTNGEGLSYTNWNVTEPYTGAEGQIDNGYRRKVLAYYSHNSSMTGSPFRLMSLVEEGAITNQAEIHMDIATGDWGEMRYVCIFDSATGGNLLAYGEIGRMVDGEWEAGSISPIRDSVVILPRETFTISID